MKTYEINVIRTVAQLYHVKAESEAEALEDWSAGELVDPDYYDNIDQVESLGEVTP